MSIININFEESAKARTEIEEGDCFLVDEQLIQIVELGNGYALIDLGEARILSTEINSIPHAINHVKKHYGEFEHIYSERLDITVKKR
jgi:hypothetical protein